MKSGILKNKKVEIIEKPIPTLDKKEGAIIKVHGCGLCGSDIVKINHSEDESSVVLGHEIVGEIVDLNVEVTGNQADKPFKKGDIIAMGHHYPCFKCKICLLGHHSMCQTFKKSNIFPGGFSEYIYIDKNHLKNTVFKKPENLSEEGFSFLEPLSCCIRAIRRSGLEFHKDNSNLNTLVLGLGSIGILMAQGLKAFGTNVFGLDINKERQKFVKKFGVEFNKDIKYDIIFMTSGSNKALQTAIELINFGGKIIVFSSIPNEDGYQNNEIYYKELSIVGSYSPAPCDIALSSELLKKETVNVKNISAIYKLEEINQAISDTKQGKILKGYIKI